MQPAVGADRIELAERAVVAPAVAELEPDDLRADARLQLVGGAAGDDLAAVEHGDHAGQLVGLLEVLRGQQDRHAVVGQVADGAPHLVAAARVQDGRRLVQDDQLRPVDHADREVEAPLHTARVGSHPPVAGVFQVEDGEQLGGPGPDGAAGKVQQPGHHLQVLLAG